VSPEGIATDPKKPRAVCEWLTPKNKQVPGIKAKCGPFPQSDHRNRFLLTATDYFAKLPEAYAIPNQEALTVAKAQVIDFCSFKVPWELQSEQGCNFKSHLIQEVLQCPGVSKMCTTPLPPQLDSMVKHYIKMVEEHLHNIAALQQRDWDARLLIILLAYWSSTHDTTGLTLASLVFRRELRLPCNTLSGAPPQQGTDNRSSCKFSEPSTQHPQLFPPTPEAGH
jgi:hypothetical protein